MNAAWRMSFRCGNQGPKMWPHCLDNNVAAITYDPIHKTDLNKYEKGEPQNLWAKLAPAQKASLKRVAYQMRKGDTIYVKEGRRIIGKGKVLGPYKYDIRNRIIDPNGYPWNHQVPVKWQRDFPPVPVLLGAEQFTVLPLKAGQVNALERHIARATAEARRLEVTEGGLLRAEINFRQRNRTIIAAKKALSDGRCEACGMSLADTYGIDKLCLIAHHKDPIGGRDQASRTTFDDIALVCPNCHAVAHTAKFPLSITAIRKMLR
jgi:hypothetical protein